MQRILSILVVFAFCLTSVSAEDRWRSLKIRDKKTGKVIHKVVLRYPRVRMEITCEGSRYYARFYLNSEKLKADNADSSSLVTKIRTRLGPYNNPEEHFISFEDSTHQGVKLHMDVEDLAGALFLLVGFELENGQGWTHAFVTNRLSEELKKMPCK